MQPGIVLRAFRIVRTFVWQICSRGCLLHVAVCMFHIPFHVLHFRTFHVPAYILHFLTFHVPAYVLHFRTFHIPLYSTLPYVPRTCVCSLYLRVPIWVGYYYVPYVCLRSTPVRSTCSYGLCIHVCLHTYLYVLYGCFLRAHAQLYFTHMRVFGMRVCCRCEMTELEFLSILLLSVSS